jgi:hypothetical protein
MNQDIQTYNSSLSPSDIAICELLQKVISESLPEAESKVWHRHPVWFLQGNPVVGYAKLKDAVQLLFWSGQSFDEQALKPEGSYKASQIRYTQLDQINIRDLKRWLAKARDIQWDYKNIVKKRGKLDRLI